MGDLVSCICITQNNKLLPRALECLKKQTHCNWEALIVHQQDDFCIPDSDSRFRYLQATKSLNLGQLRNLALKEVQGDYVAQWDDDDWYAPDRLDTQLQYLEFGVRACFLSRWTMHNTFTGELKVSNPRIWEGTIVAHRANFPQYAEKAIDEEKPIVDFFTGYFVTLNAPHLYVYTYHGGNAWPGSHFERLLDLATPISEEELGLLDQRGFCKDGYDKFSKD
jgi:glycosyltransferase involved in cell wall biosynthesis